MVLISVVMPVFNSESTVESSIKSLLDQSFTNFELICVDDGSNDGTPGILERMASVDKRVRVFTQENKGVGSARNLGLSKATGDFLMFLDADDLFDKDLLSECYACAIANDSDVVICGFNVYDTKSEKYIGGSIVFKELVGNNDHFSPREYSKYLCQFTRPLVWNRLLRADTIRKNNVHFPKLYSGDGVVFILHAMMVAGRISLVEKKLVTKRENSGPSQITANKEGKWMNTIEYFRALFKINESLPDPEMYHQSILNLVTLLVLMNLISRRGDDRREMYEFISNEFSKEIRFLEYPREYYYSDWNYLMLKEILTKPIDSVIIPEMDHSTFLNLFAVRTGSSGTKEELLNKEYGRF